MDSPQSEEEQLSPERRRSERDIKLFFYLTFGVLVLIAIVDEYEPAKLGIFFFFLSWVLLLAIHEFAHALTARLLGWHVELVAIGCGPVRKESRLLGMPVEWRTLPISGFMRPRPGNLRAPRLKNFLIYAAGPGSEIILVLLALLVFGKEALLARGAPLQILAVQCFCIAALTGVFFNLLPIPFSDEEEGTTWTDGLGMLLCWTLPDSHFEELLSGKANVTGAEN